MSNLDFLNLLKEEVKRIDDTKTSKRTERIIEGFTKESNPKGLIQGKKILIFNSNDYLGLRHHESLKKAEAAASEEFGTGPGAVRFISGSLSIHRMLEQTVAKFHRKDDAMIFSSAFATNLAVLFCLIQGQSKDTFVKPDVLVISDALNHRSIIDGIRLANLPREQKAIFQHMNPQDLEHILATNVDKFKRVLVVTDGVFSMLGEVQKLSSLKNVIKKFESQYPLGILLVVDDAHGVGACGPTGRGVEEIEKTQADVLIGTFGKAFGADGGYVTANQTIIDYLRESSATYIYSNSISPGTAGAALAAIRLIDTTEGKRLMTQLQKNKEYFKTRMKQVGFTFAADSNHPIQPILIGDPVKTRQIVDHLFKRNILVTNISYPVVAKGKDEIRVQLSATHSKEDIDQLVQAFESSR